MAFGIYVHIPYCLQICPYCDFSKYEYGKIMPPAEYVELLAKEIRRREVDVPSRETDTVYFGGGTPSLFEPRDILSVLNELAKAGFRLKKDAEVTIEIDPATVDERRLESYLEMGINRFSVGVQTFNDRLLGKAGRKHSTKDSVELLSLLRKHRVNYSFDLLFALPTQSLQELRADVMTALSFDPSHVSTYCLNVPEGHKMSFDRAPEEEQTEMFDMIESELGKAGIQRYEISNFARPGFESRHNMLYWTDQPYWGIGVSSHSFFPMNHVARARENPWGFRFWNSRSLRTYEAQLELGGPFEHGASSSFGYSEHLPAEQKEPLEMHQALTDFCHTSLRLNRGLDKNALRLKFGERIASHVSGIVDDLLRTRWLEETALGWRLTRDGRLVANAVFARLTFLRDELES